MGDVAHTLTAGGHDASEDGTGRGTPIVAPTVTRKWAKGTGGPAGDECQNLVTQPVAFRKSKRAASDQDDESWVADGAANTLNAFDAGDTRTTHAVVDVASTLTGGSGTGPRGWNVSAEAAAGGQLVAGRLAVRRLTPTETERLMGWPDGWTAPPGVKAPDSKRYAACGDGIVSWVAYWIGCRIQMIEAES